jgi:hypothetical protein
MTKAELAGSPGLPGGAPPAGPSSSSSSASASSEAALQAFLVTLPEDQAVAARTLAHAWTAAGGTLHTGRYTVRLLAQGRRGPPFTAATVHGPDAGGAPRLELGRVLLYAHGLGPADWTTWCDERPELAAHGFDRNAKYPSVPLAGLPPSAVARLAVGLRDLCLLAQGQAA